MSRYLAMAFLLIGVSLQPACCDTVRHESSRRMDTGSRHCGQQMFKTRPFLVSELNVVIVVVFVVMTTT